MSKRQEKGTKYRCRVREVSKEKLDKLYSKINQQCIDCMFDCKNEIQENNICQNKKERIDINEIIKLLKEENINMQKLCDSYGLKMYILIEMLRGNLILNFKYYTAICDRLHMIKDRVQMNEEYQHWKEGVGI